MLLEVITQPALILLMVLGVTLGIIVGAIPGLTGAMLISLTIPLTFGMDGPAALTLLVGMYVGSVSGGLITATLLAMPGTPASVITTLDGYPMTQSGKAGRALALGIGSSFCGGLFSWLALACLAKPIASASTALGPFDYFSLALMSLILVASVSDGNFLRGLFAASLGILCALPGLDPATGETRLTFGFSSLADGFKPLTVLIGLFAMSRVLTHIQGSPSVKPVTDSLRLSWSTWKSQIVNLIRSSTIGTGVGILPGIGANIGSLVAYSFARSSSRRPDQFGTGCDDGVVASESANNATVGGALIPLIALGIPGSVIDAILLGAFVIHGLQPGPLLFENNPRIVHTIVSTYFWANVVMLGLMSLSVRRISRLVVTPTHVLIPVVATFCVLGAYGLANRFFDVWVMIGFGVVGHLFERWRIPAAPFVIGFILAPLGEESMMTGLMSSGGTWAPLFTSPGSLIFLVLTTLLSLRSWKHPKPSDSTTTPQA